jgi:hypothetical protein
MLNVNMLLLNALMMSVAMLNVAMLSAVALYTYHQGQRKSSGFGVNLIKRFWQKFTFSFCELDVFIAMQLILCTIIKRSSFQKSVSKFTPK